MSRCTTSIAGWSLSFSDFIDICGVPDGFRGLYLMDSNSGEDSDQGENILLQLNFAREVLNRLQTPLLLLVNDHTQSKINRLAIDLFSQRARSNVYFDESPEEFEWQAYYEEGNGAAGTRVKAGKKGPVADNSDWENTTRSFNPEEVVPSEKNCT